MKNLIWDLEDPNYQKQLHEGIKYYLDELLTDHEFKLTYKLSKPYYSKLIFNNKYCRYKVTLGRDRHHFELSSQLGRLYAPDDSYEQVPTHEGWPLQVWFSNYRLISWYLDKNATNTYYDDNIKNVYTNIHKQVVAYKEQNGLLTSDFRLLFDQLYWQAYGERLFQLFDINTPDVWSEFSNFDRELDAFLYGQEKRNIPYRPIW